MIVIPSRHFRTALAATILIAFVTALRYDGPTAP